MRTKAAPRLFPFSFLLFLPLLSRYTGLSSFSFLSFPVTRVCPPSPSYTLGARTLYLHETGRCPVAPGGVCLPS